MNRSSERLHPPENGPCRLVPPAGFEPAPPPPEGGALSPELRGRQTPTAYQRCRGSTGHAGTSAPAPAVTDPAADGAGRPGRNSAPAAPATQIAAPTRDAVWKPLMNEVC